MNRKETLRSDKKALCAPCGSAQKNLLSVFHKIILSVVFLTICTSNVRSQSLLPFYPGEVLRYDVYYHWGLIWKKAAQGTLKVEESTFKGEDVFKMNLAVKTLSFADKIMKVRDTLNSVTTRNVVPLYYEKVANEGNHKSKDILSYIYENGKTGGDIRLKRRNKADYRDTLWLETAAYDMLSVFYYLRMINFRAFDRFQTIELPIYTGRKRIIMKVTYIGRNVVVLKNKKKYESLQLNLSFVNDTNLKDDDPPIEVWLSADERRIPLKVEGKLPLGSLQAEYVE